MEVPKFELKTDPELPPEASMLVGHRDISLDRIDRLTKDLATLERERDSLKQAKLGEGIEKVRAKIKDLKNTREKAIVIRAAAERNMHALTDMRDAYRDKVEALATPAKKDSDAAHYLKSLEGRISSYERALNKKGHVRAELPEVVREIPKPSEALPDKRDEREDMRASVVRLYDEASTVKDTEGVGELLENLPSEEKFAAMERELADAQTPQSQSWFVRTWSRIRQKQYTPDQGRIDALRANIAVFGAMRQEADRKIKELEQKRASLVKVAGENDPEVTKLTDLVNALGVARVQGGKKLGKKSAFANAA